MGYKVFGWKGDVDLKKIPWRSYYGIQATQTIQEIFHKKEKDKDHQDSNTSSAMEHPIEGSGFGVGCIKCTPERFQSGDVGWVHGN